MKPHRQPHEPLKQLLANIGHHSIADIGHEIVHPIAEHRLDRRDPQQRQGQYQQQPFIFFNEDAVQHRASQPGIHPGGECHKAGTDKPARKSRPIRADILHEPFKPLYARHTSNTFSAALVDAPGAPNASRTCAKLRFIST